MNTTFLGFQFTPFGYCFGKKIAGFIEVGYGYKGLLQVGISGSFNFTSLSKKFHTQSPQFLDL